jgi:exopolysaccharide production protein ExoQ
MSKGRTTGQGCRSNDVPTAYQDSLDYRPFNLAVCVHCLKQAVGRQWRVDTMPPILALFFWLVLLLLLLRYDPARESATSLALWVPVIWIFIVGSRLPSQWLGFQGGSVAQALEEGNPLDRTIFFVLIVLAIGILMARSFRWDDFFARNLVLMTFLSFTLLSVFWSDFPFVSFKRWFRDLGNYLVILVVLSDPRPLEAVRTVLRRLSYLLIPLSILLVKYYPAIGRQYDDWTGIGMYTGAATSKNMLGALCLVSGLFFFWDTVTRWSDRRERQTKRIIRVNIAFLAMTLWLLHISDSATSRVCLAIGCLVVLAANSRMFKRHPGLLKVLIPSCFLVYVILAFGFDIGGELAAAVGRNSTLTHRTEIWRILLSMHTNPLVGTGYAAFWLGPRFEWFQREYGGTLNEAHNGYLELYLDLGLIGIFLLVGFLVASYRTICKSLTNSSSLASLNLALWTIMLFYNMTEAAFKFHLMWVTFLLGAVAAPQPAEIPVPAAATFGNVRTPGQGRGIPLVPISFRKLSSPAHRAVSGKAGNP